MQRVQAKPELRTSGGDEVTRQSHIRCIIRGVDRFRFAEIHVFVRLWLQEKKGIVKTKKKKNAKAQQNWWKQGYKVRRDYNLQHL